MIGQPCPDCDAYLRGDACHVCGWRPAAVVAAAASRPSGSVCQDCGSPTSARDGALPVAGAWLCAECRAARLEAAAIADPPDPAVVRQGVQAVTTLCERVAARLRVKPGSAPAGPRPMTDAELDQRRRELRAQAERLEAS